MHILIVNNTRIPALKYGGTERDIWHQGAELVKMGHQVSYLVAAGSSCPFARHILVYDSKIPLNAQIPAWADVVHVHFPLREPHSMPFMVMVHGNGQVGEVFDINTVFVGRDHAERHNSTAFVYNGLGLDEYGPINLQQKRKHLLFLAKISRKEKNLVGARRIARYIQEPLKVLGGRRLDFGRGISYAGMVGGTEKSALLNDSKALLFPVRWHEPLGLAVLEALLFGMPVFGTPYGSLPELINAERGFLSTDANDIAEAARHYNSYDAAKCHQFIADQFTARHMTEAYLLLFEKVMNGEVLNSAQPRTLATEIPRLLPYQDLV
jgi:glycosyltransferase involved in cell wall biosynthesis